MALPAKDFTQADVQNSSPEELLAWFTNPEIRKQIDKRDQSSFKLVRDELLNRGLPVEQVNQLNQSMMTGYQGGDPGGWAGGQMLDLNDWTGSHMKELTAAALIAIGGAGAGLWGAGAEGAGAAGATAAGAEGAGAAGGGVSGSTAALSGGAGAGQGLSAATLGTTSTALPAAGMLGTGSTTAADATLGGVGASTGGAGTSNTLGSLAGGSALAGSNSGGGSTTSTDSGGFWDSAGNWISNNSSGLGALLQGGSALWAGQQGVDAANKATDELRRQFDIGQTNAAPWLEAGKNALGAQQDLMGLGANGPEAQLSSLMNSPGYQFRLNTGRRNLEASSAARGGMGSGKAATAMNQYGQDYASNEYGNRLNQLAGVSGTGQTQANQNMNTGMNYAGEMGNASIAGANARQSGILGAGSALSNWLNPPKKELTLADLLRSQ